MIEEDYRKAPHVVILGAGSSAATTNALSIPGPSVMEGFLEKAQLSSIIEKVPLKTTSKNFEDIYAELCTLPEYARELSELEQKTLEYIKQFHLPNDKISIYEQLILSLTPKDYIFSFNWDNLLLEAYKNVKQRLFQWNVPFTSVMPPLPSLVHGCADLGFCLKCHTCDLKIKRSHCPQCNEILKDCPIVWPKEPKNYSQFYIDSQLSKMQEVLAKAQFVTIFGFGGAKSDSTLIKALSNAFRPNGRYNVAEVEVIDIKSKEEVLKTWKQDFDFICQDHFKVFSSFKDCTLAKWPRRSVENFADFMLFNTTFNAPAPTVSITETPSTSEILRIYLPLIREELSNAR